MKSTQNDCLALAQENHVGETSCMTLQDEIDALIHKLQAISHKTNKKRRTRDDRAHWIARGRQQVLRWVAARLLAMELAYTTSYTLYLALQEYLACLDKYSLDTEEERHAVGSRNGLPIEQWKAEGEAQELPRIVRALSNIVQAHTPDSVRHILSLDGKHLVSLRHESDEQSLKCEVREHAFSAQPLQVFDRSRPPAELYSDGELVLFRRSFSRSPR